MVSANLYGVPGAVPPVGSGADSGGEAPLAGEVFIF